MKNIDLIKSKFEAFKKTEEGHCIINLNREIAGGEHFAAANDDNFTAYTKAESFVTKNGYSKGSMQRDAPIAIAEGDKYISKWRNLGDDVNKIGGVILPDPEFRDGGATVVFFKEK